MELKARDVMVTEFDSIRPETPIVDAIKMTFKGKMRETGHRTVSVMVTDDIGQIVGTISMFDVLFHFRPNVLQYDMDGITDWIGQLDPYKDQFAILTVEQVMSRDILTVSPDDHLMVVIDNMIKRNARRLPVVEDSRLIGVVFLPDVYYYLFKNWIE